MFTKACDCALHSNRSRQQALALKFWLQLLLAVSYHRDGQEQILAIEDILEYLSDIYHHSQAMVLDTPYYTGPVYTSLILVL